MPLMPKSAKKRSQRTTQPPTRYAHPFYTTIPLAQRQQPTERLLGYIQGKLQKVPPAKGGSVMSLGQIIGDAGANAIQASGQLQFHATGDTGKGPDTPQQYVAEIMAQDYAITDPAHDPAFFFHLGDVIYGHDKDESYRLEFYEPYIHYPGKIIAIPGNHDGEVIPRSDPATLRAFMANFCAPTQKVPPIAGTIFRETLNQPGVYWLLDAPFVQIVGLYSNAAENPGFISGAIPGQAQKTWLIKTLRGIAAARGKGQRKALIMATHHPPFTAGGHAPSVEMLADIDDACTKGGVVPDLFLSGHAHSYQRYTRMVPFGGRTLQIPYIVVGTGGINDQTVPVATGAQTGDHIFVKSRQGYGYLLITVTATTVTAKMVAVSSTAPPTRSDFDQVTVDLVARTAR
jgi:hypothetical protein